MSSSVEAAMQMRRLEIQCQAPAGLRDPNALAQRFTKIARAKLGDALQELLAALDQENDAIVLIRRLELELDVDLLLSERQIATLWAERLRHALLQAIEGERRSDAAVIVFQTPASFLAAFVRDHMQGNAQQRWYYKQFDGLWILPRSAALRTALCENVEQGQQALSLLRHSELAELCAVLSAEDARRTAAALYASNRPSVSASAADATSFLRAIADAWNLLLARESSFESTQLLACALVHGGPATTSSNHLVICAQIFAGLLSLRSKASDSFADLMIALQSGQISAVLPYLSSDQTAVLLPVLRSEGTPVLAAALLQKTQSTAAPSVATDWQQNSTWFGNAFLLLPQLMRLPLASLEVWEPFDEEPPERVLRWLLLCLCQGAERLRTAARDPLLRDLCGVGPKVDLISVAEWLNSTFTEERQAELRSALRAEVSAYETQTVNRRWLHTEGALHAEVDEEKERWLSLEREEGGATVNDVSTHDAADFNALWPGDRLPCRDSVSLQLCVLAQYTLKSFVARVPGFARSSIDYTWRNLLAQSAVLRACPTHIEVRLTRVPLSLMLNMAGLTRGNLSLPEFDARPLRLFEGD